MSAAAGLEPRQEPAVGGRRSSTRTGRIILIVLMVVAITLMAAVVFPFASALLFAAVLAGAFHPWMERLSRHLRDRRPLAGVLLTLAVTLLLVIPVGVLTVAVGRQVVEGVGYVQDSLREGGLPGLVSKLPPGLQAPAQKALDHFLPRGQEQIQELAGAQTGRAAAAVGGLIRMTSSLLFQTAMMLVALYFLLVDGPALIDWLGRTSPLRDQQTRELLGDFRNVSVAVLISSVATAGVQSLVALGGYLLFGVPHPLFFVAVTFVIAFIPAVGATSVTLALAGLLFLAGRTQDAILLAIWGVVLVGFSDNIVKPLLMRGRMEVHGALIFFALLGGMAVFGPVGLVAGPLVLSFFLAMVRICQRDLQAS